MFFSSPPFLALGLATLLLPVLVAATGGGLFEKFNLTCTNNGGCGLPAGSPLRCTRANSFPDQGYCTVATVAERQAEYPCLVHSLIASGVFPHLACPGSMACYGAKSTGSNTNYLVSGFCGAVTLGSNGAPPAAAAAGQRCGSAAVFSNNVASFVTVPCAPGSSCTNGFCIQNTVAGGNQLPGGNLPVVNGPGFNQTCLDNNGCYMAPGAALICTRINAFPDQGRCASSTGNPSLAEYPCLVHNLGALAYLACPAGLACVGPKYPSSTISYHISGFCAPVTFDASGTASKAEGGKRCGPAAVAKPEIKFFDMGCVDGHTCSAQGFCIKNAGSGGNNGGGGGTVGTGAGVIGATCTPTVPCQQGLACVYALTEAGTSGSGKCQKLVT
jgi:hypothetical protein